MSGLTNLTPKGSVVLWGISLLIFVVFLILLGFRISGSIKSAEVNNARINQYLAAVPTDRIGTINAVYQNTRKHLSSAMILCLLGGVFGYQRIYLGRRKSALAMFLFFWTGVPTVISLFDLAVMPRVISEYNLSVVESLYNQLAAPRIDE